MGALGSKLRTVEDGDVMFSCPGCKTAHVIDSRWSFNGNGDAPTFLPSILVRTYGAPEGRDRMTPDEADECEAILKQGGAEAILASRFGQRCHSYVTDGRIQFLTDCTHSLAGQTLPLPDFP